MLVSNACYFHGGFLTFFSHGDMNSSAYYSSSTARKFANLPVVIEHQAPMQKAHRLGVGCSFLNRKLGIKRGWSAWELKQSRIPLTAPRSSVEGLPGSFNIGPEIQNLTEKIVSQNSDYIDRLSPVWKTLRGSASLLENTASMLAQKANNLPTLLLRELKEVDNTQAAQLVSTISSHLWHEVSSLSTSPSVQHLSHSAAMLLQRVELLSEQLGSRVTRFVTEAPMDASTLSMSAENLSISVGQMMVQIGTALGVLYGTLTTELAPASTTVLVTVVASALVLASTRVSARRGGFVEGEDLPLRYNPDAVAAYFNKRSLDIIARSSQIVFECSTFAASLLIDKSLAVGKENEKMRAVQLVELITNLGPTAIKIGQALSIRPDILPVAYLEELQKLQDRVPPFSNEEAKQLILEGLSKPAEEVFSEISAEPIAAASLGQVYKATLRETGEVVAVKVQRPGVLEGISRDLYLLRSAALAAQSLPVVQSNLVALLDNWAYRFFDELDYVQEGRNAVQFAENMKTLPNIVVPRVYMLYTSRKVLTTAWVEGEKLSESNAEDLLQLVKTALNCYLMQLLESGFLHADPHPGNLLRTPNGCLCVLDFGLMTEVTEDQRYAFIEYISHLVNSEYARVAEDLVKLGFVPPELVDPEKTAAVVPQLSHVLGQLVQGGGARKVNIQQITDDLSKISEEYVFIVPPYFALILRAFSLLEGIGLKANPDYAIVNDCYPYLSKRLITDDSPRTRAALKYFLYAGKEQLDIARVEDIVSGFQTFQELIALPAMSNGDTKRKSLPPVDSAAKEVLFLLFASEGSYLQELLLTELVRAVDALSRNTVAELWRYFASQAIISLPPPLSTPQSWPIPLPGLLFGSSRIASLSADDQQSLETVKRLWVLVEPQFTHRASAAEVAEAARSMLPLISDLFPGMVTAAQRFILMLLQRQALRLADDLDGKQSIAEWDRDPAAFARRVRPRRVPTIQRLRIVES